MSETLLSLNVRVADAIYNELGSVSVPEAFRAATAALAALSAPVEERKGDMVSVDESAMQGTAALHPEMLHLLEGVVGVVEANSFERSMLWDENRRSMARIHCEPKVWKENLSGLGKTIGDFGDMPVFLSLITAEVDGQKLLFIEATSQVVDHRMVRAWLDANLPKTAFWPDGRLNIVDAQNFHNVFRAPPLGSPLEGEDGQLRDTAKSALASSTPESSEQVGWRPIETADPEDGKCILVATADTPPSVGEAWWRMNYEDKLELWWAGTSNGDYYADPISQCNQPVTHWMPLPQPPASDVGSAYPTERAK